MGVKEKWELRWKRGEKNVHLEVSRNGGRRHKTKKK